MKLTEAIKNNILIKKLDDNYFEVKEFNDNQNLFRHYFVLDKKYHGDYFVYENNRLVQHFKYIEGNITSRLIDEKYDGCLFAIIKLVNNDKVKELIDNMT